MTTIKHIYQPTGNSCGPTCLKMAYDYVDKQYLHDLKYKEPTIEDICEMCGTDWEVGTPPDRMQKGMDALGLEYIEYSHVPRPFEFLNNILETQNIPILRTITNGIPHWIIINLYTHIGGLIYGVYDPAQGPILYTEKELDVIWKLRDYQFFEVLYRSETYLKHKYFLNLNKFINNNDN